MRFLVVWAVLGAIACPLAQARAGELPEVRSKSVIVLDAATGREIFGKAADEVRPIASTTKIFVAMVVRKRGIALDGWTTITKEDARAARGGARTRLDIGETFRNRDLLKAMLMSSDNRAPTALGRAVGLDPDGLVAAMNTLAKQLGLAHTKFTCTSGLHGNTSTAREMAIALKHALADKVLREIMHDDRELVVAKDRYPKIDYTSTNQPLLAKQHAVIGGKTGYTRKAGYCFITAAKLGNREVLLAFLGAPGKASRFDDFYRLAAWLDRGAPGSLAGKRPAARGSEPRGRVASP